MVGGKHPTGNAVSPIGRRGSDARLIRGGVRDCGTGAADSSPEPELPARKGARPPIGFRRLSDCDLTVEQPCSVERALHRANTWSPYTAGRIDAKTPRRSRRGRMARPQGQSLELWGAVR